MSAPTDLPPGVFRGKTSAECGYVLPDPRDLLPLIRDHMGYAEGHLHMVRQLVWEMEHRLDGED
jgi:hypothetical protein